MARQTQAQRSQAKVTTNEATAFGQWLNRARTARGLSINALARLVGISNAHVSKMEAGKANPSRDMVYQLAAALSPEGADERTATALLSEGMLTAGYVYVSPSSLPHELVEYGLSDFMTRGPLSDKKKEKLRDFLNILYALPDEWEENKDEKPE